MRCTGLGKHSQGSGKKHHRPPSSITKGLKNLVLDNGIAKDQTPTKHHEPRASYSSISSIWTSPTKGKGKEKEEEGKADEGKGDVKEEEEMEEVDEGKKDGDKGKGVDVDDSDL